MKPSPWTEADYLALKELTGDVWVVADDEWLKPWGPIITVFFSAAGDPVEEEAQRSKFLALCAEDHPLALRAREVLIRKRLMR